MSSHHGNTPAAWTASAVALLGFMLGGIALMLSPVSMVMFWVGVVLALVALPVFLVMAKMGMNS
ncbi:MAG: HGxxPAAW family protein [Nocardioides sp.]